MCSIVDFYPYKRYRYLNISSSSPFLGEKRVLFYHTVSGQQNGFLHPGSRFGHKIEDTSRTLGYTTTETVWKKTFLTRKIDG